MRLITKTAVFALALVGTVAIAKEGVKDPTVKARQDLMATQGMNMKVLGGMAGGKVPFDAAAAEAAKAAIVATSAEIGAKFKPQATDPVTEAKPEIWTNWADFQVKMKAFETESAALATLAKGGDFEKIKVQFSKVGNTCKDCHDKYKLD